MAAAAAQRRDRTMPGRIEVARSVRESDLRKLADEYGLTACLDDKMRSVS